MSIVGLIVMGDRTSHGGTVISGDPSFTLDGQAVARTGDKVTCPRCKRVSTIISSRFPTVIDDGRPVVYDQDMTDCGALLYSRHNNHYGWQESGDDNAAASTASRTIAAEPVEDQPLKQPSRFQEHFTLRNNETGAPLAGVPYTIKTGDGNTFEGETDAQGRTSVVWTDSPQAIEVVAHPKPAADADPYHYGGQEYGGL
jgi:uncharacterized Zn-binding protein involved in type VI secretion